MQTSESIGKIALALATAQGEFKNPDKNKEVEVQPKKRDDGSWPAKYKFKYATFDVILDMARPILAKNEVAIIQTAANVAGNVAVTTRFVHSSGEWIEDTIGAPVDGRAGLQALGGAITYLKRYALTAMLGIAADEDDDANAADGNLADVKDHKKTNSSKKKDAERESPEENIGEDWQAWIHDLKGQIASAVDYSGGQVIWNSNGKPLNALKSSFPKTFEALSKWVKATCEAKPRAA